MNTMSTGSTIIWFVFFLILALPGILFLSQVNRVKRQRWHLRTWPEVEGVVLNTSIEKRKGRLARRNVLGGRRRIIVYLPIIHYSYRVGEKSFEGSRYKNSWSEEWTHPNLAKVENVLDGYPQGKLVSVHYDPADPSQAYLELETKNADLIIARLFSFAMLLGALAVLAVMIFNLSQTIMAKREIASIQSSEAMIPVSSSRVKTQVEDGLGFTCQMESFPGMQVAYKGWNCKMSTNSIVPEVQIWSRRDEPEKVDLIWVTTDQSNPEANQQLMTDVIALVFPEPEAAAAQQWYLELYSSGKSLSQENTLINTIPITFDKPSATRLYLMIGDVK